MFEPCLGGSHEVDGGKRGGGGRWRGEVDTSAVDSTIILYIISVRDSVCASVCVCVCVS